MNRVCVGQEHAAEMLDMSLTSFKRHVRDQLPVVRVGGLVMYPVWGIEQWVHDRTEREQPPAYTAQTVETPLSKSQWLRGQTYRSRVG